jgi:hypothetical protein
MSQSLTQLLSDIAAFTGVVLQAKLTATFAVAIVSASAGALAGAWAAQRIAASNKLNDDIVLEIRNTNAAVALAYDMFNTYYSLKKQLVLPLKVNFDSEKTKRKNIEKMNKLPTHADKIPVFEMNFTTLPLPYVPSQRLQGILFDKLSVTGGSLHMISLLVKSSDSLFAQIEQRNQIIKVYMENPISDETQKAHFYFGTTDGDGHTDTSYSDCVGSIYHFNDDCIMSCKLLIEDLSLHGEELKLRNKKRLKGAPQKIMKIDFSTIEEGVIPSAEEYSDWIELTGSAKSG